MNTQKIDHIPVFVRKSAIKQEILPQHYPIQRPVQDFSLEKRTNYYYSNSNRSSGLVNGSPFKKNEIKEEDQFCKQANKIYREQMRQLSSLFEKDEMEFSLLKKSIEGLLQQKERNYGQKDQQYARIKELQQRQRQIQRLSSKKIEQCEKMMIEKNRYNMQLVEDIKRETEINSIQKKTIEEQKIKNTNLLEQLEKQRRYIHQLQIDLELARNQIQRASDLALVYQKQISAFQDQPQSNKQNDYHEMISQISTYKRQSEEIKTEKNELQRQVWFLKQELETAQEKKEEVTDQLKRKKLIIAQFEENLQKIIEAKFQKQKDGTVLKSGKEYQMQFQELREKKIENEKIIQGLQNQIEEYSREKEKSKYEYEILKESQKDLNELYNKLKNEIFVLRNNFEQQMKEKQSMISQLKEKNRFIQSEKFSLIQVIKNKQQEMKKLSIQQEEIDLQNKKMQKNINQLTESLSGLSGFFNQSQEKVEKVVKKYSQSNQQSLFSFMDVKNDLHSIKQMIDSYSSEGKNRHKSLKNIEKIKEKNFDSIKSTKSGNVGANYRYRKSNIEKHSQKYQHILNQEERKNYMKSLPEDRKIISLNQAMQSQSNLDSNEEEEQSYILDPNSEILPRRVSLSSYPLKQFYHEQKNEIKSTNDQNASEQSLQYKSKISQNNSNVKESRDELQEGRSKERRSSSREVSLKYMIEGSNKSIKEEEEEKQYEKKENNFTQQILQYKIEEQQDQILQKEEENEENDVIKEEEESESLMSPKKLEMREKQQEKRQSEGVNEEVKAKKSFQSMENQTQQDKTMINQLKSDRVGKSLSSQKSQNVSKARISPFNLSIPSQPVTHIQNTNKPGLSLSYENNSEYYEQKKIMSIEQSKKSLQEQQKIEKREESRIELKQQTEERQISQTEKNEDHVLQSDKKDIQQQNVIPTVKKNDQVEKEKLKKQENVTINFSFRDRPENRPISRGHIIKISPSNKPTSPRNIPIVMNLRSLSPQTLEKLTKKNSPIPHKTFLPPTDTIRTRKPSIKFQQTKSPTSFTEKYKYSSNIMRKESGKQIQMGKSKQEYFPARTMVHYEMNTFQNPVSEQRKISDHSKSNSSGISEDFNCRCWMK